MQALIQSLQLALRSARFVSGGSGNFSLNEFRTAYKLEKRAGGINVPMARAVVPDAHLEALADILRPMMTEFVEPESDRIGNGMVNLMGGVPTPTVPEFSLSIVRAAAALGVEHTIRYLAGWIEGQPLQYRTRALLTGASVDQPMVLEEGIEISQLPPSLDDALVYVPAFSLNMHGFHDFLGATMLSVDCEAEPALYMPAVDGTSSGNSNHTWAHGKIPGFTLDTFCEALSLASSHSVRVRTFWREFGELREFNTSVFSGASFTDLPRFELTTTLSQRHLEVARDIHLKRHASGPNVPVLDTVISRWVQARSSSRSLSDRFIELRIALEALYLTDTRGELTFRLSSRGAWHLGRDFEERRNYYDTLRRAYSLASKAVHTGHVEDDSQNTELLERALDLCRSAILKTLDEVEEPDWTRLILGHDSK